MNSKAQRILFVSIVVILVALLSFILMLAVMEMPPYGNLDNPSNNYVMQRYVNQGVEESGGFNMVTNILLDYRGYDTLLETTVLFTAVMASLLVLTSGDAKQ